MYGLVNKAVEGLVVDTHGEDKWREIRETAGVDVPIFVGMDPYPDSVTYDLVGAASEVLGSPAEDLLFEFGRYWVLFVGREGYGELMSSAGTDVIDFLGNLDNLHTRVQTMMPELQPPGFKVSDATESGCRLHYFTERPGLAPFVEGLVSGVGSMFGTPVDCRLDVSRADGADHDVFVVELQGSV